MLSSDGKVAQQGSYDALSKDPNGAFMQLMEWQMSGGDTEGEGGRVVEQPEKRQVDDHSDIIDAMAEGEAEEDEADPQAGVQSQQPTSEKAEHTEDENAPKR